MAKPDEIYLVDKQPGATVQQSPWRAAMIEFLREQGGEAPFKIVLAEAMRIVPPGMAYREGIRQKKWGQDYAERQRGIDVKPEPESDDGDFQTLPQHSEEDVAQYIRKGAYKVAYRTLYHSIRRGKAFERFERDGEDLVRLVPSEVRE